VFVQYLQIYLFRCGEDVSEVQKKEAQPQVKENRKQNLKGGNEAGPAG
jgi:hypothetical protein